MKSVYWTPEREWINQDAFLIGGGPSLTDFNFELLKGRNVVGCNDAVLLGNDIIKIGVFGDAAWWHRKKDLVRARYTNPLVTNAPSLRISNDIQLKHTKRIRDGIHSGDTLGWNYSTGAMAINLAWSLGAQRIFLLGYDLMNKNGESHWHNGYKGTKTQEGSFLRFLRGFNRAAQDLVGVDVVNVTDGSSRLKCFRLMSFEDFHQYLNPIREKVAA